MVGTHALIEPDVAFAALALAVVDEQHRFGVRQRAALSERPGRRPAHTLHMTATPIPRTLALARYGDLDTTLLRELPAGRRPVRTQLAVGEARAGGGLRAAAGRAARRAPGLRRVPADRGRRDAAREGHGQGEPAAPPARSCAPPAASWCACAGRAARASSSCCCTAGCARARSRTRWAPSPRRRRRAGRDDRDRGRDRRVQRDRDADRERRALRDLAAAPAARPGRPRRARLALLPAGPLRAPSAPLACGRWPSTPTASAWPRSTCACAARASSSGRASPVSAATASRACPRTSSCSSWPGATAS